jgi:hypothetical protein
MSTISVLEAPSGAPRTRLHRVGNQFGSLAQLGKFLRRLDRAQPFQHAGRIDEGRVLQAVRGSDTRRAAGKPGSMPMRALVLPIFFRCSMAIRAASTNPTAG